MPSLRDYILQRRTEIDKEGRPLAERADELEQELADIQAKLRQMRDEWLELDKAAKAIGLAEETPPKPVAEPRKEKLPTIKEAVLAVLDDQRGVTSSVILNRINERFFEGTMPRTSLSPQLTRLKNDGKIVLDGAFWRLAKKAEGSGPVSASEPS
jgi:hypothetical protein